MSFGTRLKCLREEKELTQQQLADSVGLHRVYIAKLEGDIHLPTWDKVQALANALGTTCEAFNEPAESDEKRERNRLRKVPVPDAATAPVAPEPKPAKGKRGPKGRKPS